MNSSLKTKYQVFFSNTWMLVFSLSPGEFYLRRGDHRYHLFLNRSISTMTKEEDDYLIEQLQIPENFFSKNPRLKSWVRESVIAIL